MRAARLVETWYRAQGAADEGRQGGAMQPADVITTFMETLWPRRFVEQVSGSDLVVCRGIGRERPNAFRVWRRLPAEAEVPSWAEAAATLGESENVWFGVCLQQRDDAGRGGSASVQWAPGLWAEVDYGKPGAPPDVDTVWRILDGLQVRPTCAVHSGHGVHVYWLFEEPLDVRNGEARARLELALVGANRELRRLAREAGEYAVDKVSDLARVLRLPGTFNWKDESNGVPVALIERPEIAKGRYEARATLDWYAGLASDGPGGGIVGQWEGEEYTGDEGFDDAARWEPIVEEGGCGWARHALEAVKEDGSEPTWHALLSIAARCEREDGVGGESLCQEVSMGHRNWSREETAAKAAQVVKRAGPATCRYVEDGLGWNDCALCPWRGQIRSPIVLGRRRGAQAGEDEKQRHVANYEPDDNGAAWRFVDEYRDLVRWVPGGSWWAWDGTVWRQDPDGTRVGVLARNLAAVLKRDVAGLIREGGLESSDALVLGDGSTSTVGRRAQRLLEYAGTAGASRRMSSALSLARYDERVHASVEDFDKHPWLLNCANGVVDLRTGELLPHAPGWMLTRRVDANWDPSARSETWEEFVAQIMPDPDERRALQQLAGYTLCGATGERVAMFLYGVGDNGKSVFADSLLQLLRGRSFMTGYAQQAPEGFLARGKPASDRIPVDLAMMIGSRMVLVSELPTRLELASEFVKWVTGEGEVTARRMRENFFSFKVGFKLWVETNSRPKVKDTSNATWNRILLIPFRQEFKRVTGFKERVQGRVLGPEAPGLLAWCWAGLQDWQANGRLTPPEWVMEREELREDDDVVRACVREMCVLEAEAGAQVAGVGRVSNGEKVVWAVRTADLYQVYRRWAEDRGVSMWTLAAWNSAVRDAGFRYVRVKNKAMGMNNDRCWAGMRLNERGEEALRWSGVVAGMERTWQ